MGWSMRGDGGEHGGVMMGALEEMGGAASGEELMERARKIMGKTRDRRGNLDVVLNRLVEEQRLKVCSDGMYRARRKPGTLAGEVEHRGTTFYSSPEFGGADKPETRSALGVLMMSRRKCIGARED
jgi:hypothetical protein